jgi:transglutaminase-like putative cysteine protease
MPPRRVLPWVAPLLACIALAAAMGPALARPIGPILHERIPPDPREDLAMNALLEGDLPAALETTSGVVPAPDLHVLPDPRESTYGPSGRDRFVPDRDTSRPEMGSYDDPFTPPTAPYKRLHAYDGVGADYQLYVRSEQRVDVPIGGPPPGPNDDAFYADLVVDVEHDRNTRIPSVGPGARIVRAALAVGAEELPPRVTKDGAENWFLQVGTNRARVRARLVMELAVARAAVGAKLSDPSWSDLPRIPALPANVAREAAAVRSAIGVDRAMRPREAIEKIASYFRSFAESNDPPSGRGSIYLDLALSKKGVCRHRAFAFLVTAQSLGVPTRLITNEAHAWIEVNDSTLWRRIDLGGAAPFAAVTSGAAGAAGDRTGYPPLPDGSASARSLPRGVDIGDEAWASGAALSASPMNDDRPPSVVSIDVAGIDVHRGQPLGVHGEVRADAEPCPHVGVEVWVRSATTQTGFRLGKVATGDDGHFSDDIVVSTDVPLGEYEVVARTAGDAHCGAGRSD